MKVRIKLAPRERQRSVLDALFSGPETLRAMMEIDRPAIDGDEDLCRYLNKHKHELYSSLGVKSWEYCVDFLKETANRYLANGKDDIKTGPVPNCSISPDNKVYMPLSGLRLIDSENPAKVGEVKTYWKSNSMSYVSDFILVKEKKEYYCEFPLVKVGHASSSGNSRKKPKRRSAGHLSIAKLCELIAKAELADSAAYARVDFDNIQGKAVAGGAVELGKKR